MSFWERVGELLGYSAAALVLGPIDAVTRHERRAMRSSFVRWASGFDAIMLQSKKLGLVRRDLTLRSATGGMPATAELDVFARRARIALAIPQMPSFVRVTISRGSLDRVRYRHGPPLAHHGTLRADSETLDVEAARAILANVEHGGLGALTEVEIDVNSKELVVRSVAMTTEDAWKAIGDGVVALAECLSSRWPASYRS